jgi:hypothetical protein
MTQIIDVIELKEKILEQEAAITRLKAEVDLRKRQMDRVGLCPDHRDKFHGRCAACEKEAAEQQVISLTKELEELKSKK